MEFQNFPRVKGEYPLYLQIFVLNALMALDFGGRQVELADTVPILDAIEEGFRCYPERMVPEPQPED